MSNEIRPGSFVRWKLRDDWFLMSVGYIVLLGGKTYAQCTWFEEPCGTCGSLFDIHDLIYVGEKGTGNEH